MSVDGLVVGDDGLARPVWASADPLLREYYDTEWGMPVRDERGMFERICLEAFQSGLSWSTILRKRPAFRAAFAGFDPEVLAAFGDGEVERLMADAGIVRNRAKVLATITNARATVAAARRHGRRPRGLGVVLPTRPTPPGLVRWRRCPELVRVAGPVQGPEAQGFVFVGPTTMYALMEAVGIVDTHLVGSHRRGTSGVWGEPA